MGNKYTKSKLFIKLQMLSTKENNLINTLLIKPISHEKKKIMALYKPVKYLEMNCSIERRMELILE